MAAKKPKKLTMPTDKLASSVRVEFQWNGDKLTKKLEEAVERGIIEGVMMLQDESQRICPHDTGALMRSSRWGYDRRSHVGFVSYGDEDAPYAHFIHENPMHYFIHEGRLDHWLMLTFNGVHAKRAVRWLQDKIAKAME